MTSPKSKDMKSSILMIGSLFIMTISLSGQTKFENYLTKDFKLDSINIDFLDSNHHSNNLFQPFVYSSSKLMTENDFISKLYHDKYWKLPPQVKINHDFIIAAATPDVFRNIDNMPIIKPPMNGYLRIIKPDTTVIYYLRGQKPFNRWPIR